jgi:hypothetical protein
MKYQLGFAEVLKFVGKGKEMRKEESCKIKGVKSRLPPHCFAATDFDILYEDYNWSFLVFVD